jgi:peptide deformylase
MTVATTTDATLIPILYVPDPRLRAKTRAVTEADSGIATLSERMLAAMYAAPGIGLAAPQVGELIRLVVIDVQEGGKKAPLVLVNPEVVGTSKELATREEGCLSLPNQYADITRPAVVKVRYQDLAGARHEVEADGLLGACLQHEIDHLEGVLFVDHLSALRRNMILRKLAKELKAKEAEAKAR